jgi:hypothetical protein
MEKPINAQKIGAPGVAALALPCFGASVSTVICDASVETSPGVYVTNDSPISVNAL